MAFEDVPLGSGGSAVPLSRTSSRQCIACQHKAKLLPEIPEPAAFKAPPVEPPATAPPVLETPSPETVFSPEPVFVERVSPPKPREMAAKPENVTEALEDRDPNNLNQHVQVRVKNRKDNLRSSE